MFTKDIMYVGLFGTGRCIIVAVIVIAILIIIYRHGKYH